VLPTRDTTVPPRESWPESPPQTEAGALLTDVILITFHLNARLLEAAQVLAANGGLTAAWWQVLGAIVDQPRTVAEIGRRMRMTRQGVQRVADLLVAHHLAEYLPKIPRTGAPSCSPAPRPDTGRFAGSASWRTRQQPDWSTTGHGRTAEDIDDNAAPRRSPGGRPTAAERLRLGSSSSCDIEHQ
jgi:hypothetical protein